MLARLLQWPKAIALLLGLVSALGFAPLSYWPLTLIALAALMALVRAAPHRTAALTRGYWFGVGHFALGLNWLAGAFRYQDAMPVWLGWAAVGASSLYLAVYPAMAAGLAWRYGRRNGLAFAFWFAGAWIVTEWLRATLFTGFAWNPLGVIAVDLSIGQFAEFGGTYALSGIVIVTTAVIAHTVSQIGHPSTWRSRWRATFPDPFHDGTWPTALILPVFYGAFLALFPFMLLKPADRSPTPLTSRTVRIVQPNIGQQDKYDETFDAVNFARLEEQTGRAGSTPRLILWPEAAVPDFIGEDWPASARAREKLASLLGPKDVLLVGADKIFEAKRKTGAATESAWIGAANSVFALDAKARLLWRYDKAHLVPYGEYLPMRPLLSVIGLSRLVPGDLDFWPGPGPRTQDVPGFGRVGLQICYEIIFSGQVVDRAHRPDFIFNPSNDAWFGAWQPPQHLAQARLRAMEEGLPVVRSTPTGISAVIDADGRVLQSLPYQKAGAIETRLPVAHAPTLFARYGNILSLALAFFLAAAGVANSRREV